MKNKRLLFFNKQASKTKILNFCKCKIEKIDQSIKLLKEAKMLRLYYNEIQELPNNIFNGISNLSNNKLTAISDRVFNELNNLKYLSIRRNKLLNIPEMFLMDLVNFKNLILEIFH